MSPWRLQGEVDRVTVAGEAEEAMELARWILFNSTQPGQQLHVLSCFSATGDWTAPAFPKQAFAASEVVYKVYFTWEPSNETPGDDPTIEFAEQFLPALRDALFYEID